MDSLRVYDGPAFLDPSEVGSARYGREPLVRVALPDREDVDAMACRWSASHVLVAWQDRPGGPMLQAWVPAGWVQRIAPDASAWHRPEGRDPTPWRE
ncbi:hypothetical protein D8M15_01605 [Micrococcus sp. HSID17228]|uniref:hypothetical protein n=1 Tax=Micrococcus TaxID=1269 RepID=UPI000FB9CA75|nr:MULTISPECIES: hypothetical protein [unclassified Micrococcus]MCV7451171.1 hypothetical protein [Micrococcus luteus]RUQ43940.1 hypothetical protein D8M29_00605 [Micrococcus sp. HSID17227]RUQ45762.1 hypothetical protein D8M15_01605 [Micrococcus sp. HSID17228]